MKIDPKVKTAIKEASKAALIIFKEKGMAWCDILGDIYTPILDNDEEAYIPTLKQIEKVYTDLYKDMIEHSYKVHNYCGHLRVLKIILATEAKYYIFMVDLAKAYVIQRN